MFIDGKWQYVGDVKQLFLDKLQEPEHEPLIRENLPKIIRGHLQAQNDDSSNMIFGHEIGLRTKSAYGSIEASYKATLEGLNTQKTNVWRTLFNRGSFQSKLLEEAKSPGNNQYEGKSDSQILEELRGNPSKMLNLISGNLAPFLLECSHEKRVEITQLSEKYNALQEKRFSAENDFILRAIYPLYAHVLQHPAFFLNTEELELSALLFKEKMQIVSVDEEGNAHPVIDLVNGHLDKEAIVIHHEGLHFSRCMPCTEEDADALSLKNNFLKAKQGALQAIERDIAASQKFWSSVKEEASKITVAGAFSIGTGNPVPLGVQLARSGVNTVGHYIDPDEKNKVLQGVKLVANSGVAGVIGGNPLHIAGGLAVDVVSLYSAPEKTTKEAASLRVIGTS